MVDTKVYQLAEDFIEDSAIELTKVNVSDLAQHIQDAIEIWFDKNEPR